MDRRKSKKVKRISLNKLLLIVFLIILVCLMIHPIQLFKNNILKPISVAQGTNGNNNLPARYSESEIKKSIYVDGASNEYSIEFKENQLPKLLSYETIISHKAEVNDGDNARYTEKKDLYISEMGFIPNLNYEKRYRAQFPYKDSEGDIRNILQTAKNDSTITPTEILGGQELWNNVTSGDYKEIENQEQIFQNRNSLFTVGRTYATTKSLAEYKKSNNILTVGNGITAGEAYVMASNRNQSKNLDLDRNQQAFWVVSDKGYNSRVDSVEDITTYKGINPEPPSVGNNVVEEAKTFKAFRKSIEDFRAANKVDGKETEIYDNMLSEYKEGTAGLVAYDESKKEFLVGPFSVDYVRSIYIPLSGGQSENQTKEGIVVFNEIRDAEVYGINDKGEEIKLTDWEFVYPDVVDYDAQKKTAIRKAEKIARESGDISPTIYPYPNENFYIRFKNSTVLAITKLEFKTTSINAEAEVYVYNGQYYNVDWKGAVGKDNRGNNISYLQKTTSSSGISVPDIYQIKSASLILEEKTIQLLVGKEHSLPLKGNKIYNNYCIPLTMEIGGIVWDDGDEVEYVNRTNKNTFGIRDRYTRYNIKNGKYVENVNGDYIQNENGEYIKDEKKEKIYKEDGLEDVKVYLCNKDTGEKISIDTNEDGSYLFKYVKIGYKYYIEFEYDGIKYMSTTYLNTDINDAIYEKNSNKFKEYLDSSHAKEDNKDRVDFNNKYTEITNGITVNNSGKEILPTNLQTDGQRISNEGNFEEVKYDITTYSTGETNGNNIKSNYTGSKAKITEDFIRAATITANLTYPLHKSYVITNNLDISDVDVNQKSLAQNKFVLGTENISLNKNLVVKTKQGKNNENIKVEDNFSTEQTLNYYTMSDTYLHNINLGLMERAPLDLAVKTDVVQTMITFMDDQPEVNILDVGKKSFDVNSFDISSRNIEKKDDKGNVTEPSYFDKSYSQTIDYYRYIWKHDFVDNPISLKNDNAQLYVQYKMTVRNQAEVTSGYVTELVNYYDNELYYPVDSNKMWKYYDKDKNRVATISQNDKADTSKGYGYLIMPQLADYTSWAVKVSKDGSKDDLGQVEWKSKSKFGYNHKESNLNTMYTTTLEDEILEPGETIDVYVIYKVNLEEIKAEDDPLKDKGEFIILDKNDDGKRNLIEINAYKSINPQDNSDGGRVDIDSAPGNSEIANEITYEDDIDKAPNFKVLVDKASNSNSIIGTVWEDERDKIVTVGNSTKNLGQVIRYGEKQGNGILDINSNSQSNEVEYFENLIDNVIVELIRLEYNPASGKYEEVKFTEKYKNFFSEQYDVFNYPDTNKPLERDYEYALLTWTGHDGRHFNDGQYKFDNLISGGKYKVRFIYGNEPELRTQLFEAAADDIIYTGHDYKSTTYNGAISVRNIDDPSTKVYFVVDSQEITNKVKSGVRVGDIPVISMLTNIKNNLEEENGKINVNIRTFGAEDYGIYSNFNQIGKNIQEKAPYSAVNAISYSYEELINSDVKNKIMVIYNDGSDSQIGDVKDKIALCLKDGIKVIGIGYGTESLEMFKFDTKASGDEEVSIYSLTDNTRVDEDTIKNHTGYIETNVYNEISNVVIDSHYFKDNISHATDNIQNTSYKTMDGTQRNVRGRLEVMKYSKETDPEIAYTLNVDYIKSLTSDKKEGSTWSKTIKTLANKTQMSADSYEVSFKGSEYEIKTLNFGLQEIPKRNIDVTNKVDNIVVKLASGRKIIDWSPGATGVKNVQQIPDELFSIYMDEEIMQGATIEVKYRIDIENTGEIDTLYSYVQYATTGEQRNWYEKLTGERNLSLSKLQEKLKATETFEITKLYSYYDDLIFRAQDNNKWEVVINLEESSNGRNTISRENIRNERVVWREVTKDKLSEVLGENKGNIDRIKNNFVIETTSLKGIELFPKSSKEVTDASTTGDFSKISTYLVLSKTLSAEDMNNKGALDYNNYVEIIETSSNTGRRDYNGAEGNFQGIGVDAAEENDIDKAERITILPPFGKVAIAIGLIISALLILGAGVIFIKKKVL